MAENSHIEWTTHTFNPWWGCTKVSAACDNCYAETLATRFGTGWGKEAERKFFGQKHWNEPLKWNRKAEASGERPRVFCASMADVFEDNDTLLAERERLWRLIEATPFLIWLLLTKRPHLMTRFAPTDWAGGWPNNVWAMTTVKDQTWANARIPHLMRVPAVVRGLSMEPLVGPIVLPPDFLALGRAAWVITGGESGHGARPGHPGWYQSLRDQAVENNVPLHFKQWGNLMPWVQMTTEQKALVEQARRGTAHGCDIQIGANGPFEACSFYKMDKHDAGRLLDGRTWDGLPFSQKEAPHAAE